jgi:hypothetical protein
MRPQISSIAFAVGLAGVFASEATTAKPLRDSPARSASIVALVAGDVANLVGPLVRLGRLKLVGNMVAATFGRLDELAHVSSLETERRTIQCSPV